MTDDHRARYPCVVILGVLRSLGTTLAPFVGGLIVLLLLLLVGTPVLIAVPISLGVTILAVIVMVQRFVPRLGPYLVIGIALLLVVVVWLGGGLLLWRGY